MKDNPAIAAEAGNKTRFVRSQGVYKWLRQNQYEHASANSYYSAIRCALRGDKRSSNGMLYHEPTPYRASIQNRRYIIWQGQALEEVKHAIAESIMLGMAPFVVMQTSYEPPTDNKRDDI